MKTKILSAVSMIALGIMACNAELPGSEPAFVPTLPLVSTHEPGWLPQNDAEVPRVSIQDTLAAIENGEAVIVDVRSTAAYEESRIAGAISIPLEVIQTNPEGLDLDKDQWIITYCT